MPKTRLWIKFELNVLPVEEIKFTKELEDMKKDEVDIDITLECELSRPGLKVDWFKDNKKVRQDDKHEIHTDGKIQRLVIHKLAAEDIGTYKVEYNMLSTSAKLTVDGQSHTICLLCRNFTYWLCYILFVYFMHDYIVLFFMRN